MTRNQKYYRRGKARARVCAIEWQYAFESGEFPEHEQWSLFEWCDHFRRIGKRFGLIREFKENGIL